MVFDLGKYYTYIDIFIEKALSKTTKIQEKNPSTYWLSGCDKILLQYHTRIFFPLVLDFFNYYY